MTLFGEEEDLSWIVFCNLPEGVVSGWVDVRTGAFTPSSAPPAVPPPVATPDAVTTTPESRSRWTSSFAASCVELYSTETLRHRAFAFDGIVESLETRVDPKLPAEGSQSQELPWVTLKVNQWFKGGESPEVAIWVDPHWLEAAGPWSRVIGYWSPVSTVGGNLRKTHLPGGVASPSRTRPKRRRNGRMQ